VKEIESIYLVWRTGKGQRRHKVGIIEKNDVNGFSFRYLVTEEDVKKIGFIPYTEFPELSKKYTENVLGIFGQRLTKSERSDIQKYYDFWEINPEYKENKYYLLAHTQGLLATDNFEFLADYLPANNLSFISEICGLSQYKTPADILKEDDDLRWEKEPNNEYDANAVKVFKGDAFLGYIKIVHSSVFCKDGGNGLKIKVKRAEKNGYLNRVFIKIYNP